MKKGEVYEAVITEYDFPNKGSFVMEDRKVTIKGALPNQKVRFMLTKKKSGIAEGRVLEVLEKSPLEDAEVACPFFGVCGGCAYLNLSYENQLFLKEELVKKLLNRYLEKDVWEGILPAPVRYGYRNKMEFTFGDEYKDGPLALGLHKKGSFHDILTVKDCQIIDRDWGKILEYTVDFFAKKEVPYFHRMSHEGILRTLVVRQSKATGEFLVNLVTSTQWEKYGFVKCDGERQIADADGVRGQNIGQPVYDARYLVNHIPVLREYVEGLLTLEQEPDFSGSIAGILYTENDALGDVVQSDRTILLHGRDYIVEEIMGLQFQISPFSFFQTNTKGCEVLYQKAREYIMSGSVMDEGKGKIVFDLYSGTGTIAQMMSPAAKKVIGIEIVEEAVEAAKKNAERNGLTNCKFIAGDVLKAVDLVEEKPDVIILDPPRDGIHPKALEKILAFGVQDMVYISCKPTSLARDLERITQAGYRVVKACAVDEFPGSLHVETCCLLAKLSEGDD